jgi:hypothetical protein
MNVKARMVETLVNRAGLAVLLGSLHLGETQE